MKTYNVFANLVLLAVLSQAPSAWAQSSDNYQFFKGQTTKIKNPFELRDPFKKELGRSREEKKVSGGTMQGNTYTNLGTIENQPIEKIRIVGVLIGKDRRAMAKIEGDATSVYIIREGMTLGVDGAEVKAILPGGIVLVEKIRNVYDQDEYLETILTISNE